MRKLAVACLIACGSLCLPVYAETNGKEAVALRRIAQFWKEHDYKIALKQIASFLEEYPLSSYRDPLYMMLGDLYFAEKKYQKAYESYLAISDTSFKDKARPNMIFSLYQLRDFSAVIDLATMHREKMQGKEGDVETKIYLCAAEGCYRQFVKAEDLQEKCLFAKKSLAFLDLLKQSEEDMRFLHPKAEMYAALRKYTEAAACYETLAKLEPTKKDEFLFQEATCRLFFDKQSSIEIFGRIAQSKSKNAALATYNYLSLLFEEKRYLDLIAAHEKHADLIPNEKKLICNFYLGESHYHLSNYAQAIDPLLLYTEKELHTTSPAQVRASLLHLIACSYETKNRQLMNTTLEKLLGLFPQDADCARALLIHAHLSMEQGLLTEARADIEKILADYPHLVDEEALFYSQASILFQEKKWQESRSLFLALLHLAPNSSKKSAIAQQLINCSLEQLKEKTGDDLQTKNNLQTDIKLILNHDGSLEESLKQNLRLLAIKTLYEMGQLQEGVKEAQSYITDYPDDKEIKLLMALLYFQMDPKGLPFIEHAEIALNTVEKLDIWHLHLFNAYLAHPGYEEKAAEHLFEAFQRNDHSIQLHNQVWLANFYVTKNRQRAHLIFQKLLKVYENKVDLTITQENILLELEAIKYAALLAEEEKNMQQILLLQALVKQQKERSELSWQYGRRACFELAQALEKNGFLAEALSQYEELISSSGPAPSFLAQTAILHRARIQFSLLSSEDKQEDHPKIVEILNQLKDLQIKKQIDSEPLHLEAALDYAQIRASLETPEKRAEKYHFLLSNIKEDFNSEEDVSSKEYKISRINSPDKEQLFETYMEYIDAEILYSEALLNHDVTLTEQAKESLTALCEENLNDYLKARVQESLKKLSNSL